MTIVDPAYVLVLLQAASALSGYSIPTDPPPQVIEMNTLEMVIETCRSHQPSCENDVGFYRDGGDSIWIDEQWITEKGQNSESSYIVHELTHWLQYEHGYSGGQCPRLAAREREAYLVQRKYIIQYEQKQTTLTMPETCGYEGE